MKTESNRILKSIRQGKSDLLRSTWLVVLAAVLLTLPAQSYATRFGIVTDCHYADPDPYPSDTRYTAHSLDKLGDCLTTMNDEEVDFLIELGDFIEGDYLEVIENKFQMFNGPTYHVLGNHDVHHMQMAQFLVNVTNTGIDSSLNYYSFDVNRLHCIVLDANYRGDGNYYDKSDLLDWWETYVHPDELTWLEADLAATAKPTIVFIHQLLSGPDSDWMHHVRNAYNVRQILENSGKVLAVFQGHYHPGYCCKLTNGIHYYTLKAMVEDSWPSNNFYAIVEIQPCGNIAVTVTEDGEDETIELESNLDLDLDGVPDCQDECLDTPSGVFVGPFGCSAYQWCTSPKYDPKNRGDFVSCVAHIAEAWLDEGFIDEEEKNEIVSKAAKSGV